MEDKICLYYNEKKKYISVSVGNMCICYYYFSFYFFVFFFPAFLKSINVQKNVLIILNCFFH